MIELIHEIATVRQAAEEVVIAGMLEALLQILMLLDPGDQLLIDRVQTFACGSERGPCTAQAACQVMRAEGECPGHYEEHNDVRRELRRRVPPGSRAHPQLQIIRRGRRWREGG